ncbi:MurR/RpiR family transcriptional regulator [Rhodococcus jostii]|uniref:MurR/RpiR family transcriptional regulator n=1 Tax=Rhodococcus jostii TaxID=132919 RepID=A0ABU4CKI3_RHOJO|nr:MurR/RpiR family transcriptional regulator [Rhodococcus jostii]MDV6284064.1 MurR/RpiR family transcriptional regulator [Rhodococcus jostii]
MTVGTMLAQRTERATLGAQADRVLQVLAQMPQFASYASAREVAERAGVNVSTVVRTAQQLEFEGWSDLKKALRAEYLTSLVTTSPERPMSTDAAAQMLRQDAANLATASSAANIAAIKSVAEAINAARRIVVITTGSGAGPAQVLSYLASIYGYDIHVAAGPATSQAVSVSQMDERDCLIVINVWRLTRALRGLTRLGRERGASIAVLTDLHSSPLNAYADHVVITPIEGINATPSLTAMVAVVHAILAQLESSGARSSVGRIEQAWETLDLMDDQP